MNIKPLNNTSFTQIAECFRSAFANYFVPFQPTDQQLKKRWELSGVDYALSFGAFEKDKLLGFIMSSIGQKQGLLNAYNAGTGVIPSARGQGLSKRIYVKLLEAVKATGVQSCSLEVIQQNDVAIYTYRKCGFHIDRGFHCFSGAIQSSHQLGSAYTTQPIQKPDWQLLQGFWDFQPAWEQDIAAIQRGFSDLQLLGVYKGQQLLAYAVLDPLQGKLLQFAVSKEHRRKGIGRMLFCELAGRMEKASVINVDENATATIGFLQAVGLQHTISQYEMSRLI